LHGRKLHGRLGASDVFESLICPGRRGTLGLSGSSSPFGLSGCPLAHAGIPAAAARRNAMA